ncbi:MAG: TolB family protein [Solirubrobacterales bacterium]
MIRRLAGVLLIACALSALPVASAAAEVPAGPRLAFMRSDGARFQLVSSDPAGQDQQVIAGGSGVGQLLPLPFYPPTWSTDGTHIVFAGAVRLRAEFHFDIYDAAADGSEVAELPGTALGKFPVLSPDGHTLAFARERERKAKRPHPGKETVFSSASIWLLDVDSGVVRQLTPWRTGSCSFRPPSAPMARRWRSREISAGGTMTPGYPQSPCI